MRSFKKPNAAHCPYSDDKCAEDTCLQHKRFVSSKEFRGMFGIPTERCPKIKDQILDETIDVSIRAWMDDVFIKKKNRELPVEIFKLTWRRIAKERKSSLFGLGTVLNAYLFIQRFNKNMPNFIWLILHRCFCKLHFRDII